MKNIEAGLFIISIGIIWLLEESGIMGRSIIGVLWQYWPAVLILIGVNIILKDVPYIRIITWLLFLCGLVALGFRSPGIIIPQGGWNEIVNMGKINTAALLY